MFCKSKYPAKPHLRTLSVKLFDDLIKYLFGPKVWGLVRTDAVGNPIASPHIGHVLCYLRAILKSTTESMNEGNDMDTAMRAAWKNSEMKTVHFHDAVTIAINTPECRALTAPDLQERARPPAPTKDSSSSRTGVLALDNGPPSASEKTARNKAKRLKQKAKIADLKAVAKGAQKPGGKHKVLAIMDGSLGGAAAKPAKGKGKGVKLKAQTDAGESICYNWAKGTACNKTPCPHKHCCRICEGPHKTADHR